MYSIATYIQTHIRQTRISHEMAKDVPEGGSPCRGWRGSQEGPETLVAREAAEDDHNDDQKVDGDVNVDANGDRDGDDDGDDDGDGDVYLFKFCLQH